MHLWVKKAGVNKTSALLFLEEPLLALKAALCFHPHTPPARSQEQLLQFIKLVLLKNPLNTFFPSNFFPVSLGWYEWVKSWSRQGRRAQLKAWLEWQEVLSTGSGVGLPLSFFFLYPPLNETSRMQQKGFFSFFSFPYVTFFFSLEHITGYCLMAISAGNKKESLT